MMKQYTNEVQTAKLIELGFEKPTMKNIPTPEGEINEEWYSIGELIDILGGVSELEITRFRSGWGVYDDLRAFAGEELIDALYDMIIMLKEEGIV